MNAGPSICLGGVSPISYRQLICLVHYPMGKGVGDCRNMGVERLVTGEGSILIVSHIPSSSDLERETRTQGVSTCFYVQSTQLWGGEKIEGEAWGLSEW